MDRFFKTFLGDYYGTRCVTGEKSGDIYNDFLDSLDHLDIDVSPPTWRLNNSATVSAYEAWEHIMLQGFHRCNTYEYLEHATQLALAVRRVDEVVASLWNEELDVMWRKGISDATWHDFNKFVRDYIVSPRRRVSCAKPVEATTVGQQMADVVQRVPPSYKEVAAVSFRLL